MGVRFSDCCVTRDNSEYKNGRKSSEKDGPFKCILPFGEGEDEALQRANFQSCLAIEDLGDEEGMISPFWRVGPIERSSSDFENDSDPGTPGLCSRIKTKDDVSSLETWWGVGPTIPDRRLEEAMPGHVLATRVIKVMCVENVDIDQLCRTLPLDDICRSGDKYLLWQMRIGRMCLASLHLVEDNDMYEQILCTQDRDLLHDVLKLIVTPVKLKLSVPSKGPEDADTMGAFFGSTNVSFHRPTQHGSAYDIAALSVDLYSNWTLRMLLPSVAFKEGRMADYHIVSYKDKGVLASYRAAMTKDLIDTLQSL